MIPQIPQTMKMGAATKEPAVLVAPVVAAVAAFSTACVRILGSIPI